MLDLDLFISDEMRTALKHPLAKNLELPLPDFQQASLEEIQALQRRYAIPGVVKRIITLDATTSWEYWWCVPGRLLLPDDVELLQRVRPRVEAILSNLIWLWERVCGVALLPTKLAWRILLWARDEPRWRLRTCLRLVAGTCVCPPTRVKTGFTGYRFLADGD